MRQRRWQFPLGLALSVALIPGAVGASSRVPSLRNCPDQLLGVWRGDLDAKGLLSVRLTITETSPGQYLAWVEGATGTEEGIHVSEVSDDGRGGFRIWAVAGGVHRRNAELAVRLAAAVCDL